ncbi:TIGR03915 family putative DNA repair protein [Desulfosediminicola flagellatus]|uniref:TIGR03915 family putative DNA repair protein n=1 Tax=Desulfosediminicola flagellatus TaxID=2569541 RepID=UPI0010ABFBB8|nr:TIGR03915 family putative DNA repair protein [Desulfosediminicola flagellatus]
MNQYIYLHDGSFEGMLHAVAIAVKSNQQVRGIFAENSFTPDLFDTQIRLKADKDQALRLFNYLRNLNDDASRFAFNGYLSEDPEVGTHLYWMVKECLSRGARATKMYTHDSIRHLDTLSRKVAFEAHRFTGLIRFRIFEDGLQYAPFEPDCNIIGYCAQHFKTRLKNQQWILHDLRRNHALFWDRSCLRTIDIDEDFTKHIQEHGEIPDSRMTSEERYYQDLWKTFHTAIANRDRENLNLQRQFLPQRYWKYLIEMNE